MLPRTSVFLLAVWSAAALGQPSSGPLATSCTLTDQQFAAGVRELRDWAKIRTFYSAHFPPCPDDGMYAEGYSEIIVRTLATSWGQLPQLSVEARTEPRFKAFVLRHIDATTNEADLRRIVANASARCPASESALCAQVRRAAGKALKELAK